MTRVFNLGYKNCQKSMQDRQTNIVKVNSFIKSKEGLRQMITFAPIYFLLFIVTNGIQFQGHRTKMAGSMES